MQDRLKFRFWDTKTENIITMNERLMYTGRNFNLDLGNMIYASKRFVTMQCTGLKDKNGKLIYEGDIIVKIWDNRIFKIIWKDDACCFMAENKNFTLSIYSLISLKNDLEVIGNVYEHPELLEDK